jgi:hypothetical protein
VLDVQDLFIDEDKADYIMASKGVTEAEVFQVLWNTNREPHFFERLNVEKDKLEYAMVGQTTGGRWLRVAIEHVEAGLWRLITAYPRGKRGERDYRRE